MVGFQGYLKGRAFNEIGRRCADEGVHFCYHNHAWEFEDREGDTCGMDVLASETDPALVKNLRSIIYNLVSNSIKYSSPDRKPEIKITTTPAEGGVLLTVLPR